MLTISQHTSLTQVYEAYATGVHAVAFHNANPVNGAAFGINGVEVSGLGQGGSVSSFNVFMEHGDTLWHRGDAGSLYGFRIGDEF